MTLWVIGLSASGKSTVAKLVFDSLKKRAKNVVLLDGDEFRSVFGSDLGYTLEDRRKNAERVSRFCSYLEKQGINVVVALLSVSQENRDWNRKYLNDYFEVFLDVEMEELVRRDPKKYYAKALNGELKDFVGVDIPFEKPKSCNLVIKNENATSAELAAMTIVEELKSLGLYDEL